MLKKNKEKTLTLLPVTMQQFEDLTNEILAKINKLSDPHFVEADYMAQIVMSAIHAMDHKIGKINKEDLFESCVNRISCHVTFHVVQEIQNKIKLKAATDAGVKGDATTEGNVKLSVVPEEMDTNPNELI